MINTSSSLGESSLALAFDADLKTRRSEQNCNECMKHERPNSRWAGRRASRPILALGYRSPKLSRVANRFGRRLAEHGRMVGVELGTILRSDIKSVVSTALCLRCVNLKSANTPKPPSHVSRIQLANKLHPFAVQSEQISSHSFRFRESATGSRPFLKVYS